MDTGDDMSEALLVSVIMPVYNGRNTIAGAISSIEKQSYPHWELLVVDDMSTDDTAEIVRGLQNGCPHIRLLQTGINAGPAMARNAGIDAAKGEFIAFLDADDFWLPDKLEKQMALFEAQPNLDICYTGYSYIDKDGQPLGRSRTVPRHADYRGLLVRNVFSCSTLIIRRQSLGSLRFDGSYAHEDYQLWLRLMREGTRQAEGIPQPLAQYRAGGRNKNKMAAAAGRWDVYRRSEMMPLLKAASYLFRYVVAAVWKNDI